MKREKEDSRLYIRLSSEEKQLLKEKAEKSQLTLSEYMRRCGLNREIKASLSQVDAEAYLELGQIVSQLESITKNKQKKISGVMIDSIVERLKNLQRKAIGMKG